MFANAELFALVQRQAQLISTSDLIPKQFQGNIANCAIALEMSARIGASPFAVIQNLDVIHGRPSWRSVFLMGMINACGRFTPLQFRVTATGQPKTVDLEIERWEGPQGNRKKVVVKKQWTYTPTTCIAHAKYKATGEEVEGPPVSYDMALEEGWVAKDGSKWLTELRELMLRYRAASFFAKIHASDLTLGMQTAEEAHDIGQPMRNVTPPDAQPDATAKSVADRLREAEAAEATVDPAPAQAEPKAPRQRKASAPKEAEAPAPEQPATEQPAPAADPDMPSRVDMVAAIKESWREAEISMAQAEAIYRAKGLLGEMKKMADLTDAEVFDIFNNRGVVFNAGGAQ